MSYVSADCVAVKGGDPCVTEAVNALLAEEAAARAGRKGTNVAAIVAPVVVGGEAAGFVTQCQLIMSTVGLGKCSSAWKSTIRGLSC
jgi:hypothetical protein